MSKADRSKQAMSALQAAREESARLAVQEASNVAQRAAEAAPAAVPQEPEARGLEWRASACRLCGVTVLPGTGEQFMTERTRRVQGGRETVWVPWWKECQRCADVGGSVIAWADWLGIEQPFEMGALYDLSREFPQVAGEEMWGDGTIVKTTGPLPTGPQRYDLEPGARAGDEGYPRPWMHPAAKRGRPQARIRWAEIGLMWGEDGVRHDSLSCCQICGRSHALRPISNAPAGWRDPGNPRWTEVRIMNGLLACSICQTAYRQSSSGGGWQGWTLQDWAAAQAAGVHPVPGLAATIGETMARTAPPVPLGDERAAWEHLGLATLTRLRARTARPAPPRDPSTLLDVVRSA